MNILFVNDIPFNPIGGGLERVTDIITKELVKRGYVVFYLYGKLLPSQTYLLDYEFPALLYQLPNYDLFDNAENVHFYKQLQRDLKIDVVINQRGLGGWFNSMLSITQTKLVSVIHSRPDGDIIVFLNNLLELTAPPYIVIKRFIKRIFLIVVASYWKKKAMLELREKYNELTRYSDVIVALSKKDIDIYKKIIDVTHQTRLVAIPNPNTFTLNELSIEAKKKCVLYVGRLNKAEKEPIRLLKVWKMLNKTHKDWCLKFVGDGNEKNKMQEYVKSHGLRNVVFVGRQTDVASYYNEASFVCLTSNYEGWGMALTEGMQYGCVPFTFNNYGAAFEIIDDGLNGCLIPAFNLKKYASRLSELMQDENKRKKMSKAAMIKVKKFSVENVVNQWEDLFQSLVYNKHVAN